MTTTIEKTYRAGEMVTHSGLSYRQIEYWTRTGRLYAEHVGDGQGTPRLFDQTELNVAVTAADLIRAGFSTDQAIETARRLHTSQPAVTYTVGTVEVDITLTPATVPDRVADARPETG